MTTDTYTAKIAALLAKAESTTPEEAEALTAKAEELMIKYGIDQAMIDARRIAGAKPEEIVTEKIHFTGIFAQAFVMMGHSAATGLGTIRTLQSKNNVQYIDGKRVKSEVLYLIGFESDVAQAKLLIASLQMQAIVALNTWWGSNWQHATLTGMEKFKARRQFIISFGYGVHDRLTEMYARVTKEANDAAPGTDLVLVDRKKAVDIYTQDKYHPVASRGRGLDGGITGGAAGRAAGRNANVGGKAVGNTKAVSR